MENRNKATLRELLASGKQLMAPCAWDCLSAKALETAGFDALLLSGGAMGYMYGTKSQEGVFIDEMIRITENMVNTVSIPIVVDFGDGHGGGGLPSSVYRNVRRMALAGAAAVTIEDADGWFSDTPLPFLGKAGERGEKDLNRIMSPFAGGPALSDRFRGFRPVVERERYLQNVKAAVLACEGTDCMVIARIEAYDTCGFDEVVERAKAAMEIGAEMWTVCLGMWSEDDARMFSEALDGWAMWPDLTSDDGKPNVEPKVLDELGFNLVTFHIAEKAVMYGMEKFGREILATRSTVSIDTAQIEGLTAEQEADLLAMDAQAVFAQERKFYQS
ncbi:isocitrate lyase/PEP mutase family protein [Demequina capsici]|uniref:Isocitrate lyase/PEP mutase family protein n=1 Tax=Demequina capsici TaxID=3075620 RepID=A0AA96J6Q6_9MICO|nr:isocitrate lyase/PEP mutase family protein [Demequina sp. OYTSA14]WNM23595.1 isocitrate lyase/PEP mutase family protein [Demequina sp. OYTSA14]